MKPFKLITSLIASALLVFAPMTANAESDVVNAWKEISEKAPKEVVSMKVNGQLQVRIASQGTETEVGKMNLDLMINEEPLAAQVLVNIVSPFVGSEPMGLEMYAFDGNTYSFDSKSGKWTTEAWKATAEEIKTELNKLMASSFEAYQLKDLNEDMTNFINKYFKLDKKDGEMVFSLAESIDGKEFYNDIDKAVDFEKLIQQSAEEAKKQADQLGENLPENYTEQLEQVYNPETFDKFFKMAPKLSISYDAETGLTKAFNLSLNIQPKLFAAEMGQEQVASMPEVITLITDITFDGYGDHFDIVVPAEALNAPAEDESSDMIQFDASQEETETASESAA